MVRLSSWCVDAVWKVCGSLWMDGVVRLTGRCGEAV